MAEAVFRCFFPGRVRLFGKTNGHSRESLATNAAGKNDLLRGQNKAERNCRHAQGTQQIKCRSCHTVFLCGSFCFSVLICTPNTGCPVLGVHIKTAATFCLSGLWQGLPYNGFLAAVAPAFPISSPFYIAPLCSSGADRAAVFLRTGAGVNCRFPTVAGRAFPPDLSMGMRCDVCGC